MAIPLNLDTQRPVQRDRGLLLDTISEIPDSAFDSASDIARIWMEGVTWAPWGTDGLTTLESECATVYNKTFGEIPDYVTQPAFLLYDSLTCSTLGLSFATLAGRVRRNLNVMASAAFAAELETGAVSGGHALVGDATYTPVIVSSTGVGLAQAISGLEGHLASVLHGAEGVIHLTPGLFTIATEEGGVEWRDGAYRTPTGHVVVGDAGHTGQAAPEGESVAGDGQAWIYATGPVFYRQGSIKGLTGMEEGNSEIYIPTNTNRPLGETFGVVIFDPDTVGAALVDLAASSGGGGDASAANQTTLIELANPTIVIDQVTADETIAAANYLWGYSLKETSDSAVAVVSIHHGSASSDPVIGFINLAASESIPPTMFPARIPTPNGIHFEVVSGAVSGAIYYEA